MLEVIFIYIFKPSWWVTCREHQRSVIYKQFFINFV